MDNKQVISLFFTFFVPEKVEIVAALGQMGGAETRGATKRGSLPAAASACVDSRKDN